MNAEVADGRACERVNDDESTEVDTDDQRVVDQPHLRVPCSREHDGMSRRRCRRLVGVDGQRFANVKHDGVPLAAEVDVYRHALTGRVGQANVDVRAREQNLGGVRPIAEPL